MQEERTALETSESVCVQGSSLHISEQMLADPHVGAIIQEAYDQKMEIFWHSPPEFAENYSRAATKARMQENTLQRYVVRLFEQAYQRKAQDIHIIHTGSSAKIEFRILGFMVPVTIVDASFGWQIMGLLYNYFAQQTGRAVFSPMQRLDGRIVNPKVLPHAIVAVRLHSEPIQSQSMGSGCLMTLRLLYDATKAQGSLALRLKNLGFLDTQIRDILMLTKTQGLCLISGATGHGKSTLLKHILECMVNEMPEKSYVSVEDPPEYVIQGVSQIQVESSGLSMTNGERARNYRDALAGALRSDPDVVMIGEIRYAEALEAALSAALTGHAVWATVHANDAISCISRLETLLVEQGIPNPLDRICDQNVLRGLLHQKLVPLLCPKCKEPLSKNTFAFPKEATLFVRGKGCDFCKGIGSVAMTICGEVVFLTEDILAFLHKNDQNAARTLWRSRGGLSALEVAKRKCCQGLLDPYDVEKRFGLSLNF